MATTIDELSVFLPVYNEEGIIHKVALYTIQELKKVASKWELILINDGSRDKSLEIIEKIAEVDKRVKIINHEINKGYGAAVKEGLYAAKYPWIAFTDSDGQFDFAEITNFIEKQKETGADLVIGYYKKRQVSGFTVLTSRLWEIAVLILFGLKVKDIDCGFKFISKKVMDKIPKLESERGAFISSEFLIKAKKAGFKIEEIPVTHYPRVSGKPTGRKISVIIQSFIDLFKLRLSLK